MTVGKKLMICVAAMLAVVLSLAGAGLYSSRTLGNDLKQAVEVVAARAIFAGQLRGAIVSLREKQRGMLLYALSHDFKRAELNRQQFQEQLRSAKAAHAGVMRLSPTEKGKAELAAFEADVEKYAEFFERAWNLANAHNVRSAVAFYRDFGSPIGDRLENESQQYIDFQKAQLAALSADSVVRINWARWLSVIFVALGVGAVGLILMVVRRITGQLRTITTTLSEGAHQIAAGSAQVSSASLTLSQGASEQASSLEETSTSAEEITSMTRQNAANTGQVAQLMNTVDQRVYEGNSTLALMIDSMKQINASSDKISKIIKVIDEIAFQTNILALNAAVEAARAGEAGMGFAVVADEVRNLAQRSAQAAKDTAALIEESIATSSEGSTRLQKVADVVRSITEAAAKVKVLVDEVNIGSQEQAKGIEEVARSLAEMDKVTQGTAAAAEESAAASEQMSAQAQAFAQIVEQLQVMAGRES